MAENQPCTGKEQKNLPCKLHSPGIALMHFLLMIKHPKMPLAPINGKVDKKINDKKNGYKHWFFSLFIIG